MGAKLCSSRNKRQERKKIIKNKNRVQGSTVRQTRFETGAYTSETAYYQEVPTSLTLVPGVETFYIHNLPSTKPVRCVGDVVRGLVQVVEGVFAESPRILLPSFLLRLVLRWGLQILLLPILLLLLLRALLPRRLFLLRLLHLRLLQVPHYYLC